MKGVNWRKSDSKWVARIFLNHKRIHLGCYDSKDDAVSARLKAEKLVEEGGTPTPVTKDFHGLTESRPYRIWKGMIVRCTNQRNHAFPYYGGRGITVCERWRSFSNFIEDMGFPETHHTIERIDNNAGYFKENCRWATRKEQERNKRSTKWLTVGDKTMPVIAWAEEIGVKPNSIYHRLYRGVLPEVAISTMHMRKHGISLQKP